MAASSLCCCLLWRELQDDSSYEINTYRRFAVNKSKKPGEPLTCVWQLACHLDRPNNIKEMNVKSLKRAVSKLTDLSAITYTENCFDEVFGNGRDVQFKDFKRFVGDYLCEDQDYFWLAVEQIEEKCWVEMQNVFETSLEKYNWPNTKIRQLWYIFNRLASQNTLPVSVHVGVVDWLLHHLHIRPNVNQEETNISKINFSFDAFFKRIADSLSNGSTTTASPYVDYMYEWLVKEELKACWIHKRNHQNANWTDWSRKWVVLTPIRLTIFTDEKEKEAGKQEVIFSADTTLSLGPEKSSSMTEHPYRFKIQNLPFTELEISTDSHMEWVSWTHAVKVILEEGKTRTTPVQRLLKGKFSNASPGVTVGELTEKLNKTLNFSLSLLQANFTNSRSSIPNSRPTAVMESHDKNSETLISKTDRQMRAVFMKVDTSGNGKVDFDEFQVFMESLGLAMDTSSVKDVFDAIDTDKSGNLSYDEFADYFADILTNKDSGGVTETQLRQAFLSADRDGSGAVSFKEVSDWLLQSQQSICKDKIMAAFANSSGSEVSMDEFKKLCSGLGEDSSAVFNNDSESNQSLNQMERKLMDFYSSTDGDELSTFIQDRWKSFAAFRREGASGEVVMTGDDEIVEDFVPGSYSLIDMVCFNDLPPLIPDHTAIQGAVWKTNTVPGKSGKLICPADFNGQIRISPATTEFLRYYGCSFAEGNSVTVSLMYRHAIQDFTYESAYLDDYVKNKNGGSGLERHDFVHLDCPMEEDNGHFIMGKFVSDTELHLTAFKVPMRHTLYLPANTIHSNDYLKGSWRTLLSDESAIDHVHLNKYNSKLPDTLENFTFKFID